MAAHLFGRRHVDYVVIIRLNLLAALAWFGDHDWRLARLLSGHRRSGLHTGKGFGASVYAQALAVDFNVSDALGVIIKADADVAGRLNACDDQLAGHLIVTIAAIDRACEAKLAFAVRCKLDHFSLLRLDRLFDVEVLQREAV